MRYLGRLGRSGAGVWVRKALASEVLISENMVTNGTYGDFREKRLIALEHGGLKGKKLVNTGPHHCPCLDMAMERDKWNMVLFRGKMVAKTVT